MKKGIQESLSMIVSITIALALIAIFGFVAYAMFSEAREARENFNNFAEFFQDLVEEGKDFEGEKPLYVHKDYVIVGFNGEDIEPKGVCYGWIIGDDGENLRVKKPDRCGDDGCLCLCDYEDSIVVDKEVIKDKYKNLKEIYQGSVSVFLTFIPQNSWLRDYVDVSMDELIRLSIFSTKDICTGRKDFCIKEGIDTLNFLGTGGCNFVFIPGVVRKNKEFVERGIDEISITKKGNKVYIWNTIYDDAGISSKGGSASMMDSSTYT